LEDQIGQVALAQMIDEVGGSGLRRRVESHVERSLAGERKSTMRIVELQCIQTQIDHDAVDSLPIVALEVAGNLGIRTVYQFHPISETTQSSSGTGQGSRVSIDPEKAPVR
jgi:hypothetical protein